MKIESVDFFYLSMPQVTTAADGSQDALLVRVTAGPHVGWGECEAAPLPSIAAFVCPMSHGACQPVGASVLGETLDGPQDIHRLAAAIRFNSMDLLQAPHTWSGVEMALWDLLGHARQVPVWQLLGYRRACPKTPYASVLFGADAQETRRRGAQAVGEGFQAVKFGWAPFGQSLAGDIDHLDAAREGLGPDATLLIDAGQIFGSDVDAAAARLAALRNGVTFLEEPFEALAYSAYRELADRSGAVALAGGEASHDPFMAQHLIEYGGVGFVQIDCGRIGGIGPAKAVADFAAQRGVTYVNHTFTSNLALSASLQPYAGLPDHHICEFPTALQPLARELTTNHIRPDPSGLIHLSEKPGLGMRISEEAVRRYLVEVEIKVGGRVLFSSVA